MRRGKFYTLILFIFSLLVFEEGYSQCSSISFTSDKTTGCSPLIIKFSASNIPSGSTVYWDFGNGSVKGRDTISKIFTKPGVYDIILDVVLPDGTVCSSLEKTGYIKVLNSPVPKPVITPKVLCHGPDTVNLIDSTVGSTSRDWIIEGVSYKNVTQSFKHKFTTIGKKDITLSVTSSNGCTGIKDFKNLIDITDTIPFEFCVNYTPGKSSPTSATFRPSVHKDFVNQVDSYFWSFPGGNPSTSTLKNPSVTYSSISTPRDVRLTIKSKGGCYFTLKRVGIIQDFVTVTKDSVCIGEFTNVKGSGKGNGREYFSWSFPGGDLGGGDDFKGYNVAYKTVGYKGFTYSFKYSQNGCMSNVTYNQSIYVKRPDVTFTVPEQKTCNVPDTIVFKPNSRLPATGAANYDWRLFDSTEKQIDSLIGLGYLDKAKIIFPATGEYIVTVDVRHTNGCSASASRKVNILVPKADFEVDTNIVCAGEGFTMYSKTDPPDDDDANPLFKYHWFFQHKDSVNLKDEYKDKAPFVEFTTPGIYHAMLVIESAKQCKDTLFKINYFTVKGAMAELKATSPAGCAPHTMDFELKNISYYPPNGTQIKYQWETDPVSGVTISDPTDKKTSINFSTEGNYVIKASISTDDGSHQCELDYSTSAQMGVVAVVHKASKPFCVDDTTWLYDSSSSVINPTGRKWVADLPGLVEFFPNDSAIRPKIVYKKDTCYNISLIVWRKIIGGGTCYDTLVSKVCLSSPTADFSSVDTNVFCAPEIITFKNESSGDATSFYYIFGDGSKLLTTKTSIDHAYPNNNPDGYRVKMIAYDAKGCSDTAVKDNFIKVFGPVPSYTMTSQYACDTIRVKFTNTSKYSTSFFFDYDDGSDIDTNIIRKHLYSMKNTIEDSIVFYPVLLASDNFNCNSYFKDSIILFKQQPVLFSGTPLSGCPPMLVKFKDSTKYATGWKWDISVDGKTDSTNRDPVWEFNAPGKYSVKLVTTTRGGCKDSLVKKDYITIEKAPTARVDLSTNVACREANVKFINRSSDYASFYINYGDGSTDINTLNPKTYSFDYSDPVSDFQIFPIEVVARNNVNCTDTFRDTIRIYRGPLPDFATSVTAGCNPVSTKFTDKSSFASKTYWDYDNDRILNDSGLFVNHQFQTGYHDIKLIVVAKNGCRDSLVKKAHVKVFPNPTAAFQVVNRKEFCPSDSVVLEDKSTFKTKPRGWRWSYWDKKDTTFISSAQNTSVNINIPGKYRITLQVTDTNGCRDTISSKIRVIKTTPPSDSRLSLVTVKDGEIIVKWTKNKIPKFFGYKLFRTSPEPENLIYNSLIMGDTSYKDPSSVADPGLKPYCYYLMTRDQCGNPIYLGDPHCNVYLRVSDLMPAVNRLEWTAYSGWNDGVREYIIHRSEDSSNYEIIDTVPEGTYVYDDYRLCDQRYHYYIEAVQNNGDLRSMSNLAANRPEYVYQETPLELELVTVEDKRHNYLRWEQTYILNPKHYVIDRKLPGGQWNEKYLTTWTNEIRDRSALVNEQSYFYRVRIEDRCGYLNEPGNKANNVLLKTHYVKESDFVKLNWNNYKRFTDGLSKYVIQLRNPDYKWEDLYTSFTRDTFFTDKEIHKGLDSGYCYRILGIATGEDGDTTISNIACTTIPARLYIPSAFTPNGDQLNDTFSINYLSLIGASMENLKTFTFQIYNRWGELVWQTSNPTKGWDGKIGSELAPMGMYIYRIKATGFDNTDFAKEGTVMLLE